ncbi:type II toxin-antitoxin system VapC family toxin [Streptomyces sp. 6N223]|uniref:type II toxin-antitoxin system VapC family toxin n=1 Tax=Streptomyces sp. 6N223 TaxID=3457412 RepID=UPI003FD306F5
MIFCDVNVLAYAFREDVAQHGAYRAWLEERLAGDEPFAINSRVASGFLRVVTHRKIFVEPSEPALALAFLDDLRRAPVVVPLIEGARHWEIFERLVRKVGARGNLVPDTYLAALAIESGADFYSADRGFARFPGLRWQHPLE